MILGKIIGRATTLNFMLNTIFELLRNGNGGDFLKQKRAHFFMVLRTLCI